MHNGATLVTDTDGMEVQVDQCHYSVKCFIITVTELSVA